MILDALVIGGGMRHSRLFEACKEDRLRAYSTVGEKGLKAEKVSPKGSTMATSVSLQNGTFKRIVGEGKHGDSGMC